MRFVLIFIGILLSFVCLMELNFLNGFGQSPTKKEILNPTFNQVTEVYTRDSVLIGRLYKEDRSPVLFEEISPVLVDALIATEDIRFYKHFGVDPTALVSSLLSSAQGDARGASTLTQQLSKNLFKTRFDSQKGWLLKVPGLGILLVKMKEWITAMKLEANYEKDDILSLYLNTVSFGNNAYGIKAASKRYFGVNPADLDTVQSALLVGILKGTSLYNPVRNPENALTRRNVVLSQMQKAGFLSLEEFEIQKSLPLAISEEDLKTDPADDSYIRRAVERWLKPWAEENGVDLYADGLKIYTTIHSEIQMHAEESMQEQMTILQQRLENSWSGEIPWRDSEKNIIPDFLEDKARKLPFYSNLQKQFADHPDSIDFYLNQKKKMKVFSWKGGKEVQFSTMDSLKYYAMLLNMGFVSMDPYSGEIKAWIGGIDFNLSQFDHVNQAKRQPGSTFKTFAYLAALENGRDPCDVYVDKAVRIRFEGKDGPEEWAPRNADWVFSGRNMSMRWALGKSVNSVTAQITEEVGWGKVVEAANRAGIKSELQSVPSVSLGSSEVNVLEMVNAYATFLNQGKKVEPILIDKIFDAENKIIFKSEIKEEQVIDPEVAWLMTYMLRGGVEEPEGTSQALWEWDLFKSGNHVGGKTGTSNDYVDAWYIGMTKDLVTGVWVGCDEQAIHFRNSETGEASRTALPIFGKFMEKIYHNPHLGYEYGKFPDPVVEILRDYNCPTRYVAPTDTTSSLIIIEAPKINLEIP